GQLAGGRDKRNGTAMAFAETSLGVSSVFPPQPSEQRQVQRNSADSQPLATRVKQQRNDDNACEDQRCENPRSRREKPRDGGMTFATCTTINLNVTRNTVRLDTRGDLAEIGRDTAADAHCWKVTVQSPRETAEAALTCAA